MDEARDDVTTQAAGIGALADPTRRRLYDQVCAQPHPVGREQVARATDLPRHTVSFHLDRLVDEGLLEVEYRRLSGRTGPGAGRPSKLYRRAAREFAVTLPPRRYDVMGEVLATAVERAQSGAPMDEALRTSAHAHGARGVDDMPGQDQGALTEQPPLEVLRGALDRLGFEPRLENDALVLANCPFDALADQHRSLVCGLNRDYVEGAVDGLGLTGLEACLEPAEGRCCVVVRTG